MSENLKCFVCGGRGFVKVFVPADRKQFKEWMRTIPGKLPSGQVKDIKCYGCGVSRTLNHLWNTQKENRP